MKAEQKRHDTLCDVAPYRRKQYTEYERHPIYGEKEENTIEESEDNNE